MRTAVHLGSDVLAKTLVCVSPSPGEGKSTTASNMAIAFAQAGERTLLVDCDMREPVQHLVFEVHPHAGISDVLTGFAQIRDVVMPTDEPNLFLLPCGSIPANPSELLGSTRFAQLMQELTRKFERIIIDKPPDGDDTSTSTSVWEDEPDWAVDGA
jgi:capsular exopolysaccharide synthesis family protein